MTIKTMYHNPTANIILNEEILRTFYLKSGIVPTLTTFS